MFAYCNNNPVVHEDTQGDFLNTLVGAVVGGLVGGLTSLAKGESFWAGAAQGAVSGGIAGAGVDAALSVVATGGLTGIVGVGLFAFGGGAIGSLAGDQVYSLATEGRLTPIDADARKRAILGGVVNTFSFGFSATFQYLSKGIESFNRSRNIVDILKAAFTRPPQPLDVVITVDSSLKFAIIGSMSSEIITEI